MDLMKSKVRSAIARTTNLYLLTEACHSLQSSVPWASWTGTLVIWADAASVLYGDNITISHSYPSQIRSISFLTEVGIPGGDALLDFPGNVTAYLSAETTAFNIATASAATIRHSGSRP